jgi:hypothetical protein
MLDIDLFITASDEEASRYRILDGLQLARHAFARNEVYPQLGVLIRVHETLRRLTAAADALRETGDLTGVDLEAGRLLREAPEGEPLLAETLARWALPRVEAAVEEGRALYEFADEHAAVRLVGLLPRYCEEGFLLLPEGPRLRVVRYTVSLFDQPDGRYRRLRTTEVEPVAALLPPEAVKRTLAERHPELPHPATFAVETDLDLPVEPTLLPVAKRKLPHYLAMGGVTGSA